MDYVWADKLLIVAMLMADVNVEVYEPIECCK